MDANLKNLQKIIKHAVAGTIFVALLIGGSAAVFSAAAAGVTALSTTDSSSSSSYSSSTTRSSTSSLDNQPSQNPVSSPSTQNNPGAASSNPIGLSGQIGSFPPQSTAGVSTSSQVMSVGDFTDRLNNQLVHSHSPVSEALDSGGVMLGNKVSHSFGHFLSNVLQFLFVEQSDGSTTGTAPQAGSSGTLNGAGNSPYSGTGNGAPNGY